MPPTKVADELAAARQALNAAIADPRADLMDRVRALDRAVLELLRLAQRKP